MPWRIKTVLSLTFLIYITFLLSCREKNANSKSYDLSDTENAISIKDSTFNQKMQVIGTNYRSSITKAEKEKWLIEGIDAGQLEGKESYKDVFIKEMLKLNPNHPNTADYLWYWAGRLANKGQTENASIVYKGFSYRFKNDPRSKEAEKHILNQQDVSHDYMKQKSLNLVKNLGDTVSKDISSAYYGLVESFVLAFPKDMMCSKYLSTSAELCGKAGDVAGMVDGFGWIEQFYPHTPEAPLALFLKGFYFDHHFGDKIQAKSVYQTFLEKYPDHHLAKDTKILLDNLKGIKSQEMNEELPRLVK